MVDSARSNFVLMWLTLLYVGTPWSLIEEMPSSSKLEFISSFAQSLTISSLKSTLSSNSFFIIWSSSMYCAVFAIVKQLRHNCQPGHTLCPSNLNFFARFSVMIHSFPSFSMYSFLYILQHFGKFLLKGRTKCLFVMSHMSSSWLLAISSPIPGCHNKVCCKSSSKSHTLSKAVCRVSYDLWHSTLPLMPSKLQFLSISKQSLWHFNLPLCVS